MDLGLGNKVVIITGAARGIGKATAEIFAAEGCKTVIADLDEAGAQAAASEIGARTGGEVIATQFDVTNQASCHQLVSTVVDRFGRLDVLVNNAGLVHSHPIEEMSEKQFNHQLQVNLTGVLLLCQAAFPHLKESGKGSIVNVASIGAKRPSNGGGGYGASKAGVAMLTLVMALEWAKYGIRANAVAPYAINTDFMKPFFEADLQTFIERIPLGRVGEPDDVARAILFLSSDLAGFITGEVLDVNGGAFMTLG